MPARTHIYISSESAPTDLKIPARDAKGERPKVKGRRQTGSLGGQGTGADLWAGAEGEEVF